MPCDEGAPIPCDEEDEVCICEGGSYERKLKRRPSHEILTAQHDNYDPAGVVSVATPDAGCGKVIVKSDDEHSWFFCFLGWCYF
jgi:hypothetical protein